MNRSYSRFVPNGSRSVSASRKGTVVRAKKRRSGKAYWFPIVTMIAAVFFAASAVMPRSLFDAFAAESFSMTVNSGAGEYTVKVTGDTESVTVDSDTIAVPSMSGDDVVLAITLTESTSFTITSTKPMTKVEFGEGSSVVNSINVGNSGTTTLDISKTGISSLDLSGNKALSDAAYEISAPSSGITFKLAAPEFTGSDGEGVAFDVPGAYCDDQFENLTATMPNNAEITKKDGKFFIPYDDAKTALGENDKFTVKVVNSELSKVVNSELSNVTFEFDAKKEKINETRPKTKGGDTKSGTFTVTYRSGDGTGDDYTDAEKSGEYTLLDIDTVDFTAPEGKEFDKWVLSTPTDREYPQNAAAGETINVVSDVTYQATWKDTDTEPESPESTETSLTVEDKSKSIIKSASLDTNENIDISKLKIVAVTLSAADKKTLIAAIKKADTKFNESDPGSYYNIYIVGADGKQVNIKGSVTMTLAYPSAQVEYLNDEYTFKTYHQLSDNSIEVLACSPSASGLTFTTPSCSKFAISCSAKKQNYTILSIDDISESYALSAIAHQGTTYKYVEGNLYTGSVRMVVEKPSDSSKNAFLTAIKAFDKDFNKDDKNLLVYDIYPADASGNKLTLATGRIDVTLAYPNNTVKKNYTKYTFKVYHQLGDGSVETKQLAVGGKDGITVTTGSFSQFAVASISNNSNGGGDNPGTGESNVSANIAFLLALLSMVSFAGVYAKNKAEQF